MKNLSKQLKDKPEEIINSTEKIIQDGIPVLKLYEVIQEIILYKRMTIITIMGILSILAIGVLYLA
ncbi:MAG: hypothetical protein IPP71_02590 [Bacteroidetes bacterium]|nr:hypothetical protein [Bacteroidota bacterium]